MSVDDLSSQLDLLARDLRAAERAAARVLAYSDPAILDIASLRASAALVVHALRRAQTRLSRIRQPEV
jgi:hypothetical protein